MISAGGAGDTVLGPYRLKPESYAASEGGGAAMAVLLLSPRSAAVADCSGGRRIRVGLLAARGSPVLCSGPLPGDVVVLGVLDATDFRLKLAYPESSWAKLLVCDFASCEGSAAEVAFESVGSTVVL